MSPTPTWKLCLFGPLRVTEGVRVIDDFVTRRSAFLLARLALAHERTLTRTAAAESLWPEDYFDATRVRLRQELARLRKTLGEAKHLIEIEGESIRLSEEMIVDIDAYRLALREAASAQSPTERIAQLEKAVELSELPLMTGAEETWVQVERDQITRDRYAALLELSEAQRNAGNFEEALRLAKRAVVVDPQRREARLMSGQALADLGHAADAMLEFGGMKKPVEATANPPGIQPVDLTPKAVRPLRFATPFPTDVIYGREKELEEIRKQLLPKPGNPRLISLLGPGGIGKSRLLLEVAAQMRETYDGRIAYVDISELHDARLVPLAILRALRADSIPTDNPSERLSAVLPDEPTILALDNLEQLGARMQVFARRLLERHSELRILVTSRGALGISGEYRIQLGPLTVPNKTHKQSTLFESPALHMFIDLVHASGAAIEDESIARSIVRRLEGVPLAILLAAGRLRTLGAEELDRQLEANFDILATGRRGIAERHRSMRRVLEGSFGSLPVTLRQTLCALAVFRGGWTLAAATRVCQLEDSLDAMESLLDTGLIYVDQEGRQIRFRMLESIRSFALTLIDEDSLALMRESHAAWITELVDSVAVEYATEGDILRFGTLELEWDNVRGALEYALDDDPNLAFHLGAALASYWRYRSNGFEAVKYYEELFDRYAEFASGVDAAGAAFGQVLVLQIVEAGERSEEQDRAYSLCQDANLLSLCAKLEAIRGTRAQNSQNYNACARYFNAAEEHISNNGTECDRAFIAIQRGYCLYYQGRPEEAVSLLESGVDTLASFGELFHQFRGRQLLALASMDAGKLDIADKSLDGLLEGVRSARLVPMLAPTYNTNGKLAFRQGRFEQAMEWFTFSYEEWKERQVPWQIYEQENWIGRTHYELGHLDKAERMIRDAAVHWFDYRSSTATAMAMFGLADVLISLGRAQMAANILSFSKQCIDSTNSLILASERGFHDAVANRLKLLHIEPDDSVGLSLEKLVAACRASGELII